MHYYDPLLISWLAWNQVLVIVMAGYLQVVGRVEISSAISKN